MSTIEELFETFSKEWDEESKEKINYYVSIIEDFSKRGGQYHLSLDPDKVMGENNEGQPLFGFPMTVDQIYFAIMVIVSIPEVEMNPLSVKFMKARLLQFYCETMFDSEFLTTEEAFNNLSAMEDNYIKKENDEEEELEITRTIH